MAASVDNSVRVFAPGGNLSLESAPWTLAGSNRVLYTHVATGANDPQPPDVVKHGGASGTTVPQIGTTNTVGTFGRHGVYRLINPASGSQTSYASWPVSQDEALIISVSVKDADQTTPNRTLATATGNNSNPTVNATSVSGDLVLDFMFWLDGNGNGLSQAPNGSQVALQEIEGADLFYEGMGASSLSASGASTTMAWTLTGFTLGNTDWSTYACAIIEAVGGGGGAGQPTARRLGGINYFPRTTHEGVRIW